MWNNKTNYSHKIDVIFVQSNRSKCHSQFDTSISLISHYYNSEKKKIIIIKSEFFFLFLVGAFLNIYIFGPFVVVHIIHKCEKASDLVIYFKASSRNDDEVDR